MFRYENTVDRLKEAFPELPWEAAARDEITDLPYITYETLFVPYICEELRKNGAKLSEIFEYLETMACSEDEEVQNLLQVGILEALWDCDDVQGLVETYAKPETVKLYRKVAVFFRSK